MDSDGRGVQRLNAHAMRVSSLVEVALEPYLVAPGWRIAIDREDDGRLRFTDSWADGGGLGMSNSSPCLLRRILQFRTCGGTLVHFRVSDPEGRLTGPPPSDEMHVCLPDDRWKHASRRARNRMNRRDEDRPADAGGVYTRQRTLRTSAR